MSSIRKITFATLAVALMTLLSSGCCTTGTCGPGVGCDTGCDTGYAVSGGCAGSGCTTAGCDSCGGGPVMPCSGGACSNGCGLGLGCFAKLFNIADYGCHGCGGRANAGCGEVYYHDWISDPPCDDPCDCHGNFTGVSGGCAGGGGCGCGAEPTCGLPIEASCGIADPTCGIAVEPSCGVAGCGGGCGVSGCGLVQAPGRILFRTWTGFGGMVRNLGRGIFPQHGACNAFSGYGNSCVGCAVDPSCGSEVYFGDAGSPVGSCSTCQASNQPMHQHAPQALLSGTSAANNSRVPHHVRRTSPAAANLAMRKPPHPVVAQRQR